MKTSLPRRLSFLNANTYCLSAPAIFLSVFLLTACQETPEPEESAETPSETSTQTTPVTTNINVNEAADDSIEEVPNSAQTATDSERDVSLTELEQNLEETKTASNNAVTPSPEQAIKGAQITDVRYISAAGESLSVTFETSAAGVLNAIVTRPNQPKLTLSAPEGQGNNPTYRSADGSIQLVSHAGGGTIDLIQNNTVTSFDALSADAEVITE
ncbi:hypothetical protein R0I52_04770 [Psychrobacter sp. CAM01]|uniref:hypothetical protein n=1 Tax=Psychrobacter sp. CAM01 TaxID=3080335 RepID=UPI0029364F04|nr:hypothetical protein [Psychrobacter sp. CAM01]MDV2860022.1 hypothetical protein [Psychrobacter sp. CAM01]